MKMYLVRTEKGDFILQCNNPTVMFEYVDFFKCEVVELENKINVFKNLENTYSKKDIIHILIQGG